MMRYRIKLLFNDGSEPMLSLIKLEKPTEKVISLGMKKYGANSFEIIEL